MTLREDLRKLSEVMDLRSKKLDEIKKFLSISPNADDQDVLRMMKWWQETAADEPSVPIKPKAEADRLFREFHDINNTNQQILDRLEASGTRGRQ
jgi:DNA mismatch repair ATPase MutS